MLHSQDRFAKTTMTSFTRAICKEEMIISDNNLVTLAKVRVRMNSIIRAGKLVTLQINMWHYEVAYGERESSTGGLLNVSSRAKKKQEAAMFNKRS